MSNMDMHYRNTITIIIIIIIIISVINLWSVGCCLCVLLDTLQLPLDDDIHQVHRQLTVLHARLNTQCKQSPPAYSAPCSTEHTMQTSHRQLTVLHARLNTQCKQSHDGGDVHDEKMVDGDYDNDILVVTTIWELQ